MFEPRAVQPTDQDLIETLATKGMGWRVYGQSDHRPGSRDVPHAWRWRKDRTHIMVHIGGVGADSNVEFDPLMDEASAKELQVRLGDKDIRLDGWDLATAEGRRAFCEAAQGRLNAIPIEPEPAAEPIGTEAMLTAGEVPEFMKPILPEEETSDGK